MTIAFRGLLFALTFALLVILAYFLGRPGELMTPSGRTSATPHPSVIFAHDSSTKGSPSPQPPEEHSLYIFPPWKEVPLQWRLISVAFGDQADGSTVPLSHAEFVELLIQLELDFGVSSKDLDYQRRCLGLIATLDAAILSSSGEQLLGRSFWTLGGEPRSYFPLGLSLDSITPHDSSRLQATLRQIASGDNSVIAHLPKIAHVVGIESALRVRALAMLTSISPSDSVDLFRKYAISKEDPDVRACALVGLSRAGLALESVGILKSENDNRALLNGLIAMLGPTQKKRAIAGPEGPIYMTMSSDIGNHFDEILLSSLRTVQTSEEQRLVARALAIRSNNEHCAKATIDLLQPQTDPKVLLELLLNHGRELTTVPGYLPAIEMLAHSDNGAVRNLAISAHYRVANRPMFNWAISLVEGPDELAARQGMQVLSAIGHFNPKRAFEALDVANAQFPKNLRLTLYQKMTRRSIHEHATSQDELVESYRKLWEEQGRHQ